MTTATQFDAHDLSELHRILAHWLERDVLPNVIEFEQADRYPVAMVEQMREFGLFGATIAPSWGGLGLSASAYADIVIQISSVWMSLTGVLNSHLMVAHLVARYGTEEQQQSFLPALASGELRGGLALTEPTCGSDLQAIRTTARRDGDVYVVNGTKTWITNASSGNCLAVLVKTDPAVHPRHKGMSMLLVRKDAEEYTVPRKLGKLGYRGVDTAEVLFDDVQVSTGSLLGGHEGQGFAQVLGGLELGRLNVAARGVGLAEAALRASLKYATIRETMGKPIGQHQAVQLMLADMACRASSARLLTEQAAHAIDEGRRCDLETGMAKLVATEGALANATDALRIHGAYGYSTEDHIERYFRDAPLLCIGEGTNEIQRIVIARRLLEGIES